MAPLAESSKAGGEGAVHESMLLARFKPFGEIVHVDVGSQVATIEFAEPMEALRAREALNGAKMVRLRVCLCHAGPWPRLL